MRVNNTTRGLPAEYQEVEYIESSGTQYIDTGISANQYLSFEVDFAALGSTQDTNLFGARTGSDSNRFGLTIYSNLFHFMVGNTGTWNVTIDTDRHQASVFLNNGNFTSEFDGITDSGSVGTSVYVNKNFYLFKIDYNSQSGCPMKLYSFKLYIGNSDLVRDFVPCYRKSDNVIGMYDLVNDQFYTNAGSGTFTKGNDVPDMVEKQVRPSIVNVRPSINQFTQKMVKTSPAARGIELSEDGNYMWLQQVVNTYHGRYLKYRLGSPFDMTSMTQVQDTTINYTRGESFSIRNNGLNLYAQDEINDKLKQFSLSTAYDLSTNSLVRQMNDPNSYCYQFYMTPDMTHMYISTGYTPCYVCSYILSTPGDISTATLISTGLQTSTSDYYGAAIVSQDGTRAYLPMASTIHSGTLTTPFDMATFVDDGNPITLGGPSNLWYNGNGNMFINSYDGNLYRYTI